MKYYLHSIVPVSYTHLDVYKRQDLYNSKIPAPELAFDLLKHKSEFTEFIRTNDSYVIGGGRICQAVVVPPLGVYMVVKSYSLVVGLHCFLWNPINLIQNANVSLNKMICANLIVQFAFLSDMSCV